MALRQTFKPRERRWDTCAVGALSAAAAAISGVVSFAIAGECEPAWSPTFVAPQALNFYVYALTTFDDGLGGGPALYAGGGFTTAGGISANHIARWDGSAWSALATGTNLDVRTLTTFDDGLGGGTALYAGGDFTMAGGTLAVLIARWNGTTWSALGSGMTGVVKVLATFDDGLGRGPKLYAGGNFTTAGGTPANYIACWNGTEWTALGSGTSGVGGSPGWVNALATFDDGSGGGPALYAGGIFTTAGGTPVNRIARWNGSEWSALGSGMNGPVWSLTTFDDGLGGGPKLYAGGQFTTAGGTPANRIACWDGISWSALGSGMNGDVQTLAPFDDGSGSGPALYAGGSFTAAGGVPASRIARWNGARWSALGSGVNNVVRALASFDEGSGSGLALYVGGLFSVSPAGDSFVARWQGCPLEVAGDLDGDGSVNATDLGILLGSWGVAGISDINGDGLTDSVDLGILLGAWTG